MSWPAAAGCFPELVGEGEGEGQRGAQVSDRDQQVEHRIYNIRRQMLGLSHKQRRHLNQVTVSKLFTLLTSGAQGLHLLKVSGVVGRKDRLYRDLTATAVSLL